MSNYEKEIMDHLKNTYTQKFGSQPFKTDKGLSSYWLANYEQNLIHPMDANAKHAYGEGAGNEITTGKIGALKSSSALTYNLFWDQIAEISAQKLDARIGEGVYKVELEKKLRTLRSSSMPAHLDAFLYCKHTGEAVAVEMKMTEWLFNSPGKLRASYLNPKNYFKADFGKQMVPLAQELGEYESMQMDLKEYPCRMKRYDAFQMFKHVCGCYTACLNRDPGEIRKLTLVNCIWTLPDPSVLSPASYAQYMQDLQEELAGFDQFRRTMEPIKAEFAKIRVDFDVRIFTFQEFLALQKKTPAELDYLRRYTHI